MSICRTRRADEADDLVLGELEVDSAQDLELVERLADALELEAAPFRLTGSAGQLAAPVPRDQPVRESRERDVIAMNRIAVQMYGV